MCPGTARCPAGAERDRQQLNGQEYRSAVCRKVWVYNIGCTSLGHVSGISLRRHHRAQQEVRLDRRVMCRRTGRKKSRQTTEF